VSHAVRIDIAFANDCAVRRARNGTAAAGAERVRRGQAFAPQAVAHPRSVSISSPPGGHVMTIHAGSDHWQIAAVKARYFRFMDFKRWHDFRAIFTDDATFDHPTIGTYDDIDVAVEAVRVHIGDMLTVHHGSIPEITLVPPDGASAVFAMSSNSLPAGHDGLVRTFGHYYDEFRRVGDEWKISVMRLESVYRER
jgi:hypothetical protein